MFIIYIYQKIYLSRNARISVSTQHIHVETQLKRQTEGRRSLHLKKSKIDKDTQDNFLLIHSFYYPFLITNDYNYTFKEDCDNNSNYSETEASESIFMSTNMIYIEIVATM
ncbi:hypothetical protein ACJX0J_015980, partial [Zea mays]